MLQNLGLWGRGVRGVPPTLGPLGILKAACIGPYRHLHLGGPSGSSWTPWLSSARPARPRWTTPSTGCCCSSRWHLLLARRSRGATGRVRIPKGRSGGRTIAQGVRGGEHGFMAFL